MPCLDPAPVAQLDPRLSALTPADLEGAQALVVEAGWNQVRADWELFLALGAAWKIAGAATGLDATAAVLPHAGGFGWISMVLVRQARRRQGLATRLLERCIAHLHEAGQVPVLDATPAGRAVYRQRGFTDGWTLQRWRRAAATAPARPADPRLRPLEARDLPALVSLDAEAFGGARPALLSHLHARSAGFACVCEAAGGALAGVLLGRDGRGATQVGPLVAKDEATAIALLGHALARLPGAVLVDVLDRHRRVADALGAWGFSVERPYTRMTLGSHRAFGDERLMVAIAGPELG